MKKNILIAVFGLFLGSVTITNAQVNTALDKDCCKPKAECCKVGASCC